VRSMPSLTKGEKLTPDGPCWRFYLTYGTAE
jgi:hypothetical protein